MESKEYKQYPLKSFRLSNEVINSLEELKEETMFSYNLLFIKMIEMYRRNK